MVNLIVTISSATMDRVRTDVSIAQARKSSGLGQAGPHPQKVQPKLRPGGDPALGTDGTFTGPSSQP